MTYIWQVLFIFFKQKSYWWTPSHCAPKSKGLEDHGRSQSSTGLSVLRALSYHPTACAPNTQLWFPSLHLPQCSSWSCRCLEAIFAMVIIEHFFVNRMMICYKLGCFPVFLQSVIFLLCQCEVYFDWKWVIMNWHYPNKNQIIYCMHVLIIRMKWWAKCFSSVTTALFWLVVYVSGVVKLNLN